MSWFAPGAESWRGRLSEPFGSSTRPPQKLIVGPPIDSIAVLPASTIKSPQERGAPNCCLIGRRRSSIWFRPALSPQLFSGLKRMRAPSQPPRPSEVRYVPAQCQAKRIMNAPWFPKSAELLGKTWRIAVFTCDTSKPRLRRRAEAPRGCCSCGFLVPRGAGRPAKKGQDASARANKSATRKKRIKQCTGTKWKHSGGVI
mmetsp:Transcript_47870/g.147624  ORF Transcript_47870/g.147624 Transcript_47870/m.147624 type:complete len:200 (-) Transcript_47870:94-693(-)